MHYLLFGLLAQGAAHPVPTAGIDKPFKRPELVAITWQQVRENNNKRIVQPVWRPDGTSMPEAEVEQLLDEIKRFHKQNWDEAKQLRPLVLIFAVEERHENTTVMCSLVVDGKRSTMSSSGFFFQKLRLAEIVTSPQRAVLREWPEVLTIDAKVPNENPQVFTVEQKSPADDVELEPGIRWFVSPTLGIKRVDGKRTKGFPAAVLATGHKAEDELVKYDARVILNGGRELSVNGYGTIRDVGNGRESIHVSSPLNDDDRIERVEFTRQRFRWERYKIPLRLDLLPQ